MALHACVHAVRPICLKIPSNLLHMELTRTQVHKYMIFQTEAELYVRIKPYYRYVERVATMPGMNELNATIVLAETGIDMDVFDNFGHLYSWCGLTPRAQRICWQEAFHKNHESRRLS